MNHLNQIRTWSIVNPFLLLTDKLGKVQKSTFFDQKAPVLTGRTWVKNRVLRHLNAGFLKKPTPLEHL